MKKILILFSIVTLFFFVPHTSLAAENIDIYVKAKPFEHKAIRDGDNIFVPLHEVVGAFNGTVKWNKKNKTIAIVVDDRKLSLKVDSKNGKINGKSIKLDVGPIVIKKRLYVTTSTLSSILDKNIMTDLKSETKTIYIGFSDKPPGEPKSKLPKGAKLIATYMDSKDYSYKKELPSGNKIVAVLVSLRYDGKIDASIELASVEGHAYLVSFNPTKEKLQFSSFGPRKDFSNEDFIVLKGTLHEFIDAFQ